MHITIDAVIRVLQPFIVPKAFIDPRDGIFWNQDPPTPVREYSWPIPQRGGRGGTCSGLPPPDGNSSDYHTGSQSQQEPAGPGFGSLGFGVKGRMPLPYHVRVAHSPSP